MLVGIRCCHFAGLLPLTVIVFVANAHPELGVRQPSLAKAETTIM